MFQDLRYAIRALRRSPGFVALAIATLGLGMAVTSTFFTLVDAAALRGLPLQDPDRLINVSTRSAANAQQGVSYQDYIDISRNTRTLSGLAGATQAPVALADEGHAAERVLAAYVSANALSMLGNVMVLGRDFSPDDDRIGAAPTVILSFELWRDRYASDPSIVGRAVRINGIGATVIGVMPDKFIYTGTAGLWLPLTSLPGLAAQPRSARPLNVFGRLADGATLAQAAAEIERLGATLAAEHADTNTDVRAVAVPLNERYTQRLTGTVWPTFIAAGLIALLVSCANVANLLLARALRRGSEVALRSSLGASRGRILRQMLIESALLACAGGALGVALSLVGLRLLYRMVPSGAVPYWFDFRMSAGVLGALALVCVATVFLFGFIPALHGSHADVHALLTEATRGGTNTRRSRRWTTAFLGAQLALAFMLLALNVLTVRRSFAIDRIDVPLAAAQVTTTSVTLPATTHRTSDQRMAFYERLRGAIRGRADVRAVSVATTLAYSGAPPRRVDVEGRSSNGNTPGPSVRTVGISEGYFASLGVGPVRGRELSDNDGGEGVPAAIVNARFVDAYLRDREPIGMRIRVTPPNASPDAQPWLTIVGVAPTIYALRADPETEPIVYMPFRSESPAAAVVLVRSATATPLAAATLRDEFRAVDPDVPTSRTMALEQALRENNWPARVSNVLVIGITIVSTLLALVGFYAVMAHAVTGQIRELGIRIALGARLASMWWFVTRSALGRIAIGIALGFAATIFWERTFGGDAFFGMRLTDPQTLVGTGTVVALVCLLACWSPARRAARIDPIAAIKNG